MSELPDTISITWCVDDVMSIDSSLTDEQAREVLQLALKRHDASQGITWDSIDENIRTIKKEYEV